jgi:hypothetical protein
MAENLGKWPSKRGPITKIMPSDGCGSNYSTRPVTGSGVF